MIQVNKTAENLDDGIKNMMNGAKDDYVKWSTLGGKELSGYNKEQVDTWDSKIRVMNNKKYIKIETSIYSGKCGRAGVPIV